MNRDSDILGYILGQENIRNALKTLPSRGTLPLRNPSSQNPSNETLQLSE